MKKFLTILSLLTVVATPAFAQSFGHDSAIGDVLTVSYHSTALRNANTAVHPRGLHSFALVPERGLSRVPPFDFRRGTSEYPYGPGFNFPYPDRPYGDPDHW